MGSSIDSGRMHSSQYNNTEELQTTHPGNNHTTTRQLSEQARCSCTQNGPIKIWFQKLWADVKAVCGKNTSQITPKDQLQMRDGLDAAKLSHRLRAFFEKAPIQRMAVAAALVLACIAGYKLFGTGLLVAGIIGLAVAGIGFASKRFNNSTQENATDSSRKNSEAVVENDHQQQPSTTTA